MVGHDLIALGLQVRDAYVERVFLIIQEVAEVYQIGAIQLAGFVVGRLVNHTEIWKLMVFGG